MDLYELLSEAVPPAGVETWEKTEGLTKATLDAAIAEMRDPRYPPRCGSSRQRPHVFHPSEIDRLIAPGEDAIGATDWAACANCGALFAMRKLSEAEPS